MIFGIEQSFKSINIEIIQKIELYGPKVLGAIVIIIIGGLIARALYLFLMYLFKKFKLNQLVDKLKVDFDEENIEQRQKAKLKKRKNFTDKIKVDDVVAKSSSVFVFIIFFRLAISYIGITEVEIFLKDLIDYLPSLFIGVLIGFFGIRFANFIYDVIFHTLSVTKEKTSKIIASGAKVIILFFTLMLVLDYTKIVSEFILNTILIGFIAMLSLAGGLAFGLGGREIAHDILESFRK